MPRPARTDVPGLVHHVTARSVDGHALFRDDLDRHAYLARLTTVVHRFGVEVLDFCLMPNHVHVLARGRMRLIGRAVQDAHGGYARAFNDRHERVGHLFAGRYKAKPVLEQRHLHGCLRYIARNPVEAELCGSPAGWAWSGHRALAESVDTQPFHAVDATLHLLAPTTAAGRRAYAEITAAP